MNEQELRAWFEGRELKNGLEISPGMTVTDVELFKSTALLHLATNKSDNYRRVVIQHLKNYVNAYQNTQKE